MSQKILNHIKFALYDMAFGGIKQASAGGSKMGAFILSSCFIDYMAGFVCGKQSTGKDYKNFVKQYLPSEYDPEKLYTDLRCMVVHNYSEGGSYIFTDNKSQLHGKEFSGRMIVNLENFIDDLESSLNRFLQELESDVEKRKKAIERYNSIGLLGIGSLEIKAT